jgi:hypothetical protein
MDVQTLTTTRRALHGIAECVLAGPQYRRTGELALRQSPGGFATTAGPALRVELGDLVVDEHQRIPLVGTFAALAESAGVEFGEAANLYHDHSGVAPDDEIELDETAAAQILEWFAVGARALTSFAPELPARLWPEHFDLAVDLDDATFGVSPGDAQIVAPYAYVSVKPPQPDEFWNAAFGAVRSADAVPTSEAVAAFWREGHRLLR